MKKKIIMTRANRCNFTLALCVFVLATTGIWGSDTLIQGVSLPVAVADTATAARPLFPAYPLIVYPYCYFRAAVASACYLTTIFVYLANDPYSPILYLITLPASAAAGLVSGGIAGAHVYKRSRRDGVYRPVQLHIGGVLSNAIYRGDFYLDPVNAHEFQMYAELPRPALQCDRIRFTLGQPSYNSKTLDSAYIPVRRMYQHSSRHFTIGADHFWKSSRWYVFYSGLDIGYAQAKLASPIADQNVSKETLFLSVHSGFDLHAIHLARARVEASVELLGPSSVLAREMPWTQRFFVKLGLGI